MNYNIATVPLGALADELLPSDAAVADSRFVLNYFRLSADRRLIFGGGERYRQITESFNSIRDDTKKMVDQLDDQKIDLFERINNVWMKISRGDVADRFDTIKEVDLDVTRSTKDQIQR